MAAGLPVEGSAAGRHAGDVARAEVPVCSPEDTIADIDDRTREWGVCIVRDGGGCVLGEVAAGRLALGPDAPVADIMERAPTTIRPSMPLDQLRARFERSGASHFVVTTLAGHVVGLVTRADVDAAT